ncbi:hypothetical protein BKA61DRAFT_360755 [Leptodontidium sp. MPI-SDFR-AT-0119]|nr:hypothetical protein BKA61DRAFT_360755 [Leptodontidium sp. MPI-SDFR-AT-0119]
MTNLKRLSLKQIIRLGGADARFTIPSYLLPHHEHILPTPPPPSDDPSSEPKMQELEQGVVDADWKPKTLQAERALEKMGRARRRWARVSLKC